MKKLLLACLLALGINANGQTTATNWTAIDCNMVSHTLFNELDSGKVIVFVWVMPCMACEAASITAYNIVQNFATSHPGKVRFYIADDMGSTCSALNTWITSNSIGSLANMTVFGNAGAAIDEDDYGGSGMPHVVVMGGSNHEIFFNKLDGDANDSTGITNAITSAIAATNVESVKSQEVSFSVSPNPLTRDFTITHKNKIRKVIVSNLSGQVVKEETYTTGKLNPTISMHLIARGVYTVKVIDNQEKVFTQKIVKE